MANAWYNRGKAIIFDSTCDVVADTIKFALGVGATYAFDNNHNFANAGGAQAVEPLHASNEASGTGYTQGFAGSGRKTLAGKAITEDDTNDYAKFTATNLTWTAINGFTSTYGILYKHITSDAASPLLAFFDSGFPFTANGGDVNLNFDATNGVATLA